ncbi:hypothetical protein THAOC_04370 [Thalassiosira oceanica]|uniref:Uncharacterized protein n=1 Tax=Thalassiosira oceanica TaxID=159749 RepID=K0TJ90_THAOC|nr:hypothetical protein THAOC_04370 [Thalassiosira oceanica]|eukprot:EJK73981.1 hypothetical protein THAOC_04370 [Thalassiosira oceanica]
MTCRPSRRRRSLLALGRRTDRVPPASSTAPWTGVRCHRGPPSLPAGALLASPSDPAAARRHAGPESFQGRTSSGSGERPAEEFPVVAKLAGFSGCRRRVAPPAPWFRDGHRGTPRPVAFSSRVLPGRSPAGAEVVEPAEVPSRTARTRGGTRETPVPAREIDGGLPPPVGEKPETGGWGGGWVGGECAGLGTTYCNFFDPPILDLDPTRLRNALVRGGSD